jgi:hypothetical protein
MQAHDRHTLPLHQKVRKQREIERERENIRFTQRQRRYRRGRLEPRVVQRSIGGIDWHFAPTATFVLNLCLRRCLMWRCCVFCLFLLVSYQLPLYLYITYFRKFACYQCTKQQFEHHSTHHLCKQTNKQKTFEINKQKFLPTFNLTIESCICQPSHNIFIIFIKSHFQCIYTKFISIKIKIAELSVVTYIYDCHDLFDEYFFHEFHAIYCQK